MDFLAPLPEARLLTQGAAQADADEERRNVLLGSPEDLGRSWSTALLTLTVAENYQRYRLESP